MALENLTNKTNDVEVPMTLAERIAWVIEQQEGIWPSGTSIRLLEQAHIMLWLSEDDGWIRLHYALKAPSKNWSTQRHTLDIMFLDMAEGGRSFEWKEREWQKALPGWLEKYLPEVK